MNTNIISTCAVPSCKSCIPWLKNRRWRIQNRQSECCGYDRAVPGCGTSSVRDTRNPSLNPCRRVMKFSVIGSQTMPSWWSDKIRDKWLRLYYDDVQVSNILIITVQRCDWKWQIDYFSCYTCFHVHNWSSYMTKISNVTALFISIFKNIFQI